MDVNKFTSGKFIFTVVVAGVFAYVSCRGMLSTENIMNVIILVTTFYFTKNNNDGGRLA